MSLHTELPIYKKGIDLLSLAFDVQQQMPRDFKRSIGEKIHGHCVDMLNAMALANATRQAERTRHIEHLLTLQHVTTILLRVSFEKRIDKTVLQAQLHARIPEPAWRWLADVILLHDPRTDVDVRSTPDQLCLVPAHKSLFNADDRHGLPIGNLSSQFFANVFLNELDQFVKHQLRAPRYVRYVDDFVLIHESPQWLRAAHDRIEAFLPEHLGVQLNPRKTILQSVNRGIDFVGFVIRPWRRTTRPRTVRTALHRIQSMPADDVYTAANSYLGLLRQATHSHHDRALVAGAALSRGHAVNGSFTKVFHRRPTTTTEPTHV
jgi:hypothetical protein